jgi:hypothetical protein
MRAPALPITSVRWMESVTSAMYALEVLPTPDQKPSHARAAKRDGTLLATPVARKPRATPSVETISTGRRPSLSEAYPVQALDAMLNTANVANREPRARALPPRSSRKYAKTESPSDTLMASRTTTVRAPARARLCNTSSAVGRAEGRRVSDVAASRNMLRRGHHTARPRAQSTILAPFLPNVACQKTNT